MTTKPPDGIQALVVRLNAIHEARPNRPPGAVLPYYMVRRDTVSDDHLTQRGTHVVDCFDKAHDGKSALKNAYDVAMEAHTSVLALCPRWGAQVGVIVDGTTIYADKIECIEGPTWVKYSDDGSIERFVLEFQIDWRFVAVA